uniref:Uncharacterized protein n=1 Tax=Brassica oleracea var. oleracea TaxID=109376 RepID=A0A0D3C907_BRAOL
MLLLRHMGQHKSPAHGTSTFAAEPLQETTDVKNMRTWHARWNTTRSTTTREIFQTDGTRFFSHLQYLQLLYIDSSFKNQLPKKRRRRPNREYSLVCCSQKQVYFKAET